MPAIPDNTALSPEQAVTVLLSEYDSLKAEQRSRIGFRDNLLYAALTAMAAIATVTAGAGRLELLLLLPLVTTVLGWTHLTNDHLITEIGRYVREGLGPRLAGLVDDGSSDIPMFEWETEHSGDQRRCSRKVLQLGVNLAAFCLPPFVALVVVWAAGLRTPAVLAVSLAELAVVAVLAVQIVLYADVARQVRTWRWCSARLLRHPTHKRRSPVIPEREKIGTEDIASWRAIPSRHNPEGHETGQWLVVAGDDESAVDVYLEVLHVEYPKQVAEFIVEAVQSHATRLRLSAALGDVCRERERLRERNAVTVYQLENFRLMALMARIGRLASELESPASPREPNEQTARVYDDVTQVAALAVAWLEDIHAGYGVGGPGLPDTERQAS